MNGLAVHALHEGLFIAGLVTVALVVWSTRRGRRPDRAGDEHDRRVEALRTAAREGTLTRPPEPPAPGKGPAGTPDA